MARPRTPSIDLEIRGAYRKDPQRRRTKEPKPSGGIGKPPAYLAVDERKTYRELLTASDGHIVEIGAVLLAKFRCRECDKVAEIGLLIKCISQLGMTPADRSKIGIEPHTDTGEGDPWAYFKT